MLLLHSSDGAEALIPEARQRTRRRRAVRAAALLVVAGIAGGLYALLTPAGPGVIAETADSPLANARAFRGHGELAFVSRDQLWVLDNGGTLRHLRVPAGYTAASPTFSRDARWLAYVVRTTNQNHFGRDQLWIAHADGTAAHRVAGVRLDQLVGWSPRGDVLAATVGEQLKYVPHGSATAVDLVRPPASVRTLVDTADVRPRTPRDFDAVGGASWSPNGRALAVVLQAGGAGSEIETFSTSGSAGPTVWFAVGQRAVRIAGMPGRVPTEVIPQIAGWWRGRGIAFWVIDFGGVDNRDSTPLAVIARPGGRPRYLAETLSLGLTDEVSPGAGGKLALVASSTDAGRSVGSGKLVEICRAQVAGCRALAAAGVWFGPRLPTPRLSGCSHCARVPAAPADGTPGSGVSEDPAWSPNGRLLAYLKAPAYPLEAWPSDSWFADHAVYVWNSVTGATRRVSTVDGAALPSWSGDGRELMYESNDGLWLMPIATGKAVEIVHPLYSEADWNSKFSHLAPISYYGQIPWQDQFSWWSNP